MSDAKQAWCMTCFDWRQDPQQLQESSGKCCDCGGEGEIFVCDIDAPKALQEMTRVACRENEELRHRLADAREALSSLSDALGVPR